MTEKTDNQLTAAGLFLGGLALMALGILPFVVPAVSSVTAVIGFILMIVVILGLIALGSGSHDGGSTYIFYNSGGSTASTGGVGAGWILAFNIVYAVGCFALAFLLFKLAFDCLEAAENCPNTNNNGTRSQAAYEYGGYNANFNDRRPSLSQTETILTQPQRVSTDETSEHKTRAITPPLATPTPSAPPAEEEGVVGPTLPLPQQTTKQALPAYRMIADSHNPVVLTAQGKSTDPEEQPITPVSIESNLLYG